MATEKIDLLADRVAAGLDHDGSARQTPLLYRSLLRLLAHGEPVTIAQLAQAAGEPEAAVRRAVATWTDTEYDYAGRVVGYGLTLRPTPHRFTVDGRRLYTWCAIDTLFFPAVIGQRAQVESPCHATGRPVRLTVAATGITHLDPTTAVVSIVTCAEGCGSVRTEFCDQVHFFAHPDTAAGWRAEHPGATVLPVAAAYRIAGPLADALLGQRTPGPLSTQTSSR